MLRKTGCQERQNGGDEAMDTVLSWILVVLIGYLLGSLNSALIVGGLYGKDIRQHGSGNAGLTNAFRVLGKTAAAFTALGDILKGIAACVLGSLLLGDTGAIIAGAASVIGHNWPAYFGFRGGKGALTSISVVYYLDWRIGIAVTVAFIIMVLFTGYVSVGSITGAVFFPVLSALVGKDTVFIAFSVFLGILVIARHRANIGRLLRGQESKLKLKRE